LAQTEASILGAGDELGAKLMQSSLEKSHLPGERRIAISEGHPKFQPVDKEYFFGIIVMVHLFFLTPKTSAFSFENPQRKVRIIWMAPTW
jgi:hypothetical protein